MRRGVTSGNDKGGLLIDREVPLGLHATRL
jgi:hypothetical protein